MRRPGEEPSRGGKASAHPLGEDLSKVYSGRERWPRPEGAKTNPPADSSLIRRRGRASSILRGKKLNWQGSHLKTGWERISPTYVPAIDERSIRARAFSINIPSS